MTDARVLAVNGYPVQRQPSAPSQAAQQPLQGAPAAAPDTAPKASNIPSSPAAYAILGVYLILASLPASRTCICILRQVI